MKIPHAYGAGDFDCSYTTCQLVYVLHFLRIVILANRNSYREKKATAKNMDKKPKNVSYSEYKMRNFVGHHNPKDRALNMEKSAANVLKRIEII